MFRRSYWFPVLFHDPDPAPPPAPPAPPWFQGKLDNEGIGWLQNHGLDTATPADVAVKAISSAREAQKFIGVPPTQLLKIPKEASDEAGWKVVHQRLGKPALATEYDFSNVKVGDKPLADDVAGKLRDLAFSLNLSKDGAISLAQNYVKMGADIQAASQAERTAQIAADRQALDKSWGSNKEANLFIAKQALKAFSLDPEVVNLIESQIGYGKTMNFFLALGQKMGEDKFVTSNTPDGSKIMTKEQASAKIGELQADPEWRKRYLAGGETSKEWKEFNALLQIQMGIAA